MSGPVTEPAESVVGVPSTEAANTLLDDYSLTSNEIGHTLSRPLFAFWLGQIEEQARRAVAPDERLRAALEDAEIWLTAELDHPRPDPYPALRALRNRINETLLRTEPKPASPAVEGELDAMDYAIGNTAGGYEHWDIG